MFNGISCKRFCLLFSLILSGSFCVNGYADCYSPTAKWGALEYFSSTNEFKYCQLGWTSVPAPNTLSGSCSQSGQREWDSGTSAFKYCDGSSWKSMVCESGVTQTPIVLNVGPSGCNAVGDTCADGTIYAGSLSGYNYFVSPYEEAVSTYWQNGITTNASSTSDGVANDAALTALTITNYPAAQTCENLTANSKTDWYLPAKDELAVLCNNQAAIGGFTNSNTYWSSTEYSPGSAYTITFTSCSGSFGTYKGTGTPATYTRCVRRSTTQDGSCTTIGGTCSDGSKYAGTLNSNYLYTPTADNSTTAVWWTATPITNATSTTDGAANQTTISTGFTISNYPAFNVCKTSSYGGYTDWFLPSQKEMRMLCYNKTPIQLNQGDYITSTENSVSLFADIWPYNNSCDTDYFSTKTYNAAAVRCTRKATQSAPTWVANTKSSGAAWTAISNMTLRNNDSLILCISSLTAVTSVTWNGITMNQDATGGSTPLIYIYSLSGATAGTGNIVINGTTGARAVTAMTVMNLATSSALDQHSTVGPVTTTDAYTPSATTTQANELVYACIAINGPIDNAPGAWNGMFVDQARTGTTGSGANSNVVANSGFRVVNATGTYGTTKVGGGASRPMMGAIASYKAFTSTNNVCSTNATCSVAGQIDAQSGGHLRYCDGSNWRILVP